MSTNDKKERHIGEQKPLMSNNQGSGNQNPKDKPNNDQANSNQDNSNHSNPLKPQETQKSVNDIDIEKR